MLTDCPSTRSRTCSVRPPLSLHEEEKWKHGYRIGQTRPVTVYRLITQGTIEEKIVRLHHEKRDIADKLLEGTDQATKLSAADLIEILRS